MTKKQRKPGYETVFTYIVENDMYECEFHCDGKYLMHVFLSDRDGAGEAQPHGVSGASDKVTKKPNRDSYGEVVCMAGENVGSRSKAHVLKRILPLL